MLFALDYWRNVSTAAHFLGGVYSNRDHKGNPNARPPLQVVEAAKQREGMKMLVEQAFRIPPVPPAVLNYLAATNWLHWGVTPPTRGDYPIHMAILSHQDQILGELLDPSTLSRLQDSESQLPPEADAYTAAEHLRLVVDGVFSEWKAPAAGDYTPRKPYLPAYRRNLQREAVRRISMLVTIPMGSTDDARTLARFHLVELDKQITAVLGNAQVKLDDYSRSHLQDCQERIRKILQANVIVPYVN
ncbi:MAG: zinc-dependent metalloprotease [Planctomycetales bacterium]